MDDNTITCKVCNKDVNKYHFQQHLKKYHSIDTLYFYGEQYNVTFKHQNMTAMSMCCVCKSHYSNSMYRARAGNIDTHYIEIMQASGCLCGKGAGKNIIQRDKMLFGHADARKDMFKGRFTLKWYIERFGEADGKKRYEEKHKRSSGSLEAFIKRDGLEEGTRKYNSFSDKCGFYNTLEGHVCRHGEDEGWIKYKHYTSTIKKKTPRGMQRYLDKGCNEIDAREKARKFNSLGSNLEHFKKKYGNEEGTTRYINMLHKKLEASKKGVCRYSKLSQTCFTEIIQYFNIPEEDCYLGSTEKIVNIANGSYHKLDFYNEKLKLWIEFNGDFWHANPKLYSPEFKLSANGTYLTVPEIWERDATRIKAIKEALQLDPIIIWESDWYSDKDKIMADIKTILTARSRK